MSRPKNLKGIKGVKLDLKRALSRLRSQLESMEEILEEDNPFEIMGHAHAAAQDAAHVVEECSAWGALARVVDDTYMDPKLEVGVEDPLLMAVADLVNQSTMPGASMPQGYHEKWKKVYALLRGEGDGSEHVH